MARNWNQIADDFQQKYVGTFCRYLSPLTKRKEVFMVSAVMYNGDAPFDFTLYNPNKGEIMLTYDTDADIDFSYPETGYFQHGKFAYFFRRRNARQWKKGICDGTVRIEWPYETIYPYNRGVVNN